VSKRIIVSGSRDWDNQDPVLAYLESLPEGSTVIEGGAPGLDRLVRNDILRFGLPLHVVTYWANWNWLGKAAGGDRNQRMVDDGADEAAVFPLPQSRGTHDLARRAESADIRVVRP
jgi:hypothetical protein